MNCLTESSENSGKQITEHKKLRRVLIGNKKGRLFEACKIFDGFDEFTHNSKIQGIFKSTVPLFKPHIRCN